MRGDRVGERLATDAGRGHGDPAAALHGGGLLVEAPGGVLAAQAAGAVEIDGAGGQPRGEAGRLQEQAAVLGDEAATVEDQAVVGPHQVDVGNGRLIVGGAGGDHLPAGGQDPEAEGGGGEVQDQLRPSVAATAHRPVGGPEIFADLEGEGAKVGLEEEVTEGDAVDRVDEPGAAAGEGAPLVEDVVGGELLLGHEAQDRAAVDQGGAVVEERPPGAGDPEGAHHPELGGGPGEALELPPLGVDEGPPLDEILRRVARDRLLGEEDHLGPRRRRRLRPFDRAIDVVGEGADGGVEAGEGEADQAHGAPW